MTTDLFAHDAEHAPTGACLLQAFPQDWPIHVDWQPVVDAFWQSESGQHLVAFLRARLAAGAVIYPPQPMRALELTPLSQVKAVIVGQDPYHGSGQAQGLAFSVAPGVDIPPSLRNLFKELQRDLGLPAPRHGSLTGWAERGVLLLNTALTVEQGQAASHSGQGWEILTDALLAQVASDVEACVYLLWGAHAQAKAPMIEALAQKNGRQALILKANHPSPLSATRGPVPFIGCGHFSAAQAWLREKNIDWNWNF